MPKPGCASNKCLTYMYVTITMPPSQVRPKSPLGGQTPQYSCRVAQGDEQRAEWYQKWGGEWVHRPLDHKTMGTPPSGCWRSGPDQPLEAKPRCHVLPMASPTEVSVCQEVCKLHVLGPSTLLGIAGVFFSKGKIKRVAKLQQKTAGKKWQKVLVTSVSYFGTANLGRQVRNKGGQCWRTMF